MPWGGAGGSISETNPNPEFETLKAGDVSGGNYFEVEADGTEKKNGDATVWDDVVNSLIGKRLFSVIGTIDYDYDENAIIMQSGGDISDQNDRVIFNLQYPHAAITNGQMRLHMHWNQENATQREFTVQYRIQSNGDNIITSWTTAISNSADDSVFTYTSGTINQITELVAVDMTDAGISATVQFRLARTDSTDGNISVTFVDAHVEFDTDGSRGEYSK